MEFHFPMVPWHPERTLTLNEVKGKGQSKDLLFQA